MSPVFRGGRGRFGQHQETTSASWPRWRLNCGELVPVLKARSPIVSFRCQAPSITSNSLLNVLIPSIASRPMDFIPLMERQRFEVERIKQLLRGDAEAPIEAPTMPAKPVVETGPAADDLADLVGEFQPAENAADTRIIGDSELVAAIRGSRFTLAAADR